MPDSWTVSGAGHVNVRVGIVPGQVQAVTQHIVHVVAAQADEYVGDVQECIEERSSCHTAEVLGDECLEGVETLHWLIEVPLDCASRHTEIDYIII